MIDRSLLEPSLCEFIVLGDTHSMLPSSDASREMRSRVFQSQRANQAVNLAATLNPLFAVHLGDIVQEFPENSDFTVSMQQAIDTLEQSGMQIHYVAGNHDVGDKPDPTVPTNWASSESLDSFTELVGPSWYSWDHSGWHFVVLNSQVMNTGLSAEQQQRVWFETDLRENGDRPTIVFLHMAPFLVRRGEPWIGHYDNIGEPSRSWFVSQIENFNVRMVFAGHSHFRFFNRVSETRLTVAPSTSFTRPGFSEIFSSSPPPEQGRDDIPKLGFLFVRIQHDHVHVNLVRTQTAISDNSTESHSPVLTRTSAELPDSPLGLIGRHQLATSGEVPVAWPSMIRQPMRNDYPLLSSVELGARTYSSPASDLHSPVQRERLEVMRDEGVNIRASWIWSPELDLLDEVARHCKLIDAVEIQFPNELHPHEDQLRSATEVGERFGVEVTITPLMARDITPGKQHARARLGYRVGELNQFDEYLRERSLHLQRITCRVDPWSNPWDVMVGAREVLPLERVSAIDWLVEIRTPDEHEQLLKVVESMLGAALYPNCRVSIDPFMDLDRTMDVANGLLDRQSNPRPAFHAARLLNSLLFADSAEVDRNTASSMVDHENGRYLVLESASRKYSVFLPNSPRIGNTTVEVTRLDPSEGASEIANYDLYTCTRTDR